MDIIFEDSGTAGTEKGGGLSVGSPVTDLRRPVPHTSSAQTTNTRHSLFKPGQMRTGVRKNPYVLPVSK